MKISRFALIAAILLAVSVPAYAHGPKSNHSHEIGATDATIKATNAVNELIGKGKLDSSWAGVMAKTAEKKTFGNGPEWVVTFVNRKEKNESKRTLFVFISTTGQYIAANHTGK